MINTLKREIRGIVAVRPEGDKINRAHAVTPQIESGNVYLPGAPNHDHTNYDRSHTPSWVQDLVEEAAAFPQAKHDDQVDALTQALNRAGTHTRPARILKLGANMHTPPASQVYNPHNHNANRRDPPPWRS